MWWVFPVIVLIIVIVLAFIKSYKELKEAVTLKEDTYNNLGKTLSMRYSVMQDMMELSEGYISDENKYIVKLLQVKLVPLHERFIVETELMETLRELIFDIEKVPEIKQSRQFYQLLQKLEKAEKNIKEANTYLNEKIDEYNKLLIKFPNNITAKFLKYKIEDNIDMDYITI